MCVRVVYTRSTHIFKASKFISWFLFFSCVVSFHFFCYFCFYNFSLISLYIIIIFLSLIFIREILPFVCAFYLVDFWITYSILGIDFKWRNKIQKKRRKFCLLDVNWAIYFFISFYMEDQTLKKLIIENYLKWICKCYLVNEKKKWKCFVAIAIEIQFTSIENLFNSMRLLYAN